MRTQIVRAVRHSLKDAEKNISPEGIALVRKYAPIILDPLGNEFSTYVGPLPRCTQTAVAMGIRDVIVEDLFHIPDSAMDVINGNMLEIKSIAKEQECTGVAAILKMQPNNKAISEMLDDLDEQVQEGIAKVCLESLHNDHILVISHSPVIDSAVVGYATGGLKELDWVDFIVQNQVIVHTIVCHHVIAD